MTELGNGLLVRVHAPTSAPPVRVLPALAPPALLEPPHPPSVLLQLGTRGPQGPQGAGSAGQPRWVGEGPPGVIIGAHPGDEYLDDTTGDIYRLS